MKSNAILAVAVLSAGVLVSTSGFAVADEKPITVVGEIVRLPMVASRRLQLAAEKTGTMGLVVRRWRRLVEASDFGQPTASTTRWRVSVLPSEALPVPGVGRPRWLLELIRVKAGECAEFVVGACDATSRIHLSAGPADRADQTDGSESRIIA